MGDRIAVMNKGVIQQCDKPLTLYNHPANLFVAGFIGSPAMNFVDVKIVAQDGLLIADAGAFQVVLPPKQAERARDHVGKTCLWGIRPEDIYDKQLVGLVQSVPGNTIQVDVDVIEPLGNDVEMYLKVGEIALIAMIDSASPAKIGDRIDVVFDMEKTHLFDKDTEQALY